MAVRKRTYHAYSGPLTSPSSRFLIPFRYALGGLLKSRLCAVYLSICLLVAVGFALFIYASHSAAVLVLFRIPSAHAADLVNGSLFFYFLFVELQLAFVLTAFAGPGLISPDLANQALALYLCRPFSRAEYVLGKFSVLAVLLSIITWIPGLILFAIQADLAGSAWAWSNLWVARSILLGSLIVILIFSVLGLALSAWFKRKFAAGGVLIGIFVAGSGFGQAINAALGTHWGTLVNLGMIMEEVERSLFRLPQPVFGRIPAGTAWLDLLGIGAFCLYLLERRIRGREVARS